MKSFFAFVFLFVAMNSFASEVCGKIVRISRIDWSVRLVDLDTGGAVKINANQTDWTSSLSTSMASNMTVCFIEDNRDPRYMLVSSITK